MPPDDQLVDHVAELVVDRVGNGIDGYGAREAELVVVVDLDLRSRTYHVLDQVEEALDVRVCLGGGFDRLAVGGQADGLLSARYPDDYRQGRDREALAARPPHGELVVGDPARLPGLDGCGQAGQGILFLVGPGYRAGSSQQANRGQDGDLHRRENSFRGVQVAIRDPLRGGGLSLARAAAPIGTIRRCRLPSTTRSCTPCAGGRPRRAPS